jgi:nicotinate phosphoribosyltransferase
VRDEPIIKSLLEQDQYKFGMSNMILHAGHHDTQVGYELKNRSHARVQLASVLDLGELREQIAAVRGLSFQTNELRYLHSLGYLGDDYLNYLSLYLRLPEPQIEVWNDELRIGVEGRWIDSIWWEIPILAIVNELYFRTLMDRPKEYYEKISLERLDAKIDRLLRYPQLMVTEFGLRRRLAAWNQRLVLERMLDKMPRQIVGTSNVLLAMLYNLKPSGTMAHELFSAYMGLYGQTDGGLLNSQRYVIRDWWNEYRGPLSIALTDTVGSEWFFQNFGEENARNWWGLRQDSGDPFSFGHRAVEFYRGYGIDPRRKMVIFSDGLVIDLIIRLFEEFYNLIGVGFGWGTSLTNDVGFDTLSLVMKLIMANGVDVVKISDNPAKAMGNPRAVERAKRVFDTDGGIYEEPLR